MHTVWRTSHSYTFLIPHFRVMYFNVWINRQVKWAHVRRVLVSSSLVTSSSYSTFLCPWRHRFWNRHLLRLETGFQVRHQGKSYCESADTYSPLFTLPTPVLAHFSLDSPSTPVLWKRHPSHFIAPELLEIGMKVRGDCNKTEMNFFIINY